MVDASAPAAPARLASSMPNAITRRRSNRSPAQPNGSVASACGTRNAVASRPSLASWSPNRSRRSRIDREQTVTGGVRDEVRGRQAPEDRGRAVSGRTRPRAAHGALSPGPDSDDRHVVRALRGPGLGRTPHPHHRLRVGRDRSRDLRLVALGGLGRRRDDLAVDDELGHEIEPGRRVDGRPRSCAPRRPARGRSSRHRPGSRSRARSRRSGGITNGLSSESSGSTSASVASTCAVTRSWYGVSGFEPTPLTRR